MDTYVTRPYTSIYALTSQHRTKNSHLLAESREIDSYMTESEDEEDEEVGDPSLTPKEFDNSILGVIRSLLNAARKNPLPRSTITSVTLRLTCLDPSPADPAEYDPRIAQTIDLLCDMGIDVQLGERNPSRLLKISPASQCAA